MKIKTKKKSFIKVDLDLYIMFKNLFNHIASNVFNTNTSLTFKCFPFPNPGERESLRAKCYFQLYSLFNIQGVASTKNIMF